jgi:hypothetical protein
MSVLLDQSSLTKLLNHLSLCNQGIAIVAKETEDEVKRHGVKASKDNGVEDEVKRHGVKGVKASKDDGVKGSYVSFRQVCRITRSIISY